MSAKGPYFRASSLRDDNTDPFCSPGSGSDIDKFLVHQFIFFMFSCEKRQISLSLDQDQSRVSKF